MKARPFAGDAAKDPELATAIHQYQAELAAAMGLQASQMVNAKMKTTIAKVNNT